MMSMRRQTERLELRLAPAELARLRAAARAAGCAGVSTWVRTIALHVAAATRELQAERGDRD